jgi:hypothetical protein
MQDNIPEDYRPSDDEPYMSPLQLAYFRQKLLEWRGQLLDESDETIQNLRNEQWREPDPNDRASRESDASLELRTRDRYRNSSVRLTRRCVVSMTEAMVIARRPVSPSACHGWKPVPLRP